MYYIVIDEHVEIKLFQLNFELIKWISMLIRCLWFSTVGKSSWISYIQAIINHWRILWNAPETCTNMINTDDFIIPQCPNRYGTVFTTKEKNQSNHFISYLFINLFVDYSLARFMYGSKLMCQFMSCWLSQVNLQTLIGYPNAFATFSYFEEMNMQ